MKYTEKQSLEFMEQFMSIGEEWYQYMHGQRLEPDEPETIMKRCLAFFEGDWIGLIDFDLSMGVWSTKYFYNHETKSTSETLIQDAECAEQAERWRIAILNNEPVIIGDIEEIKDEAPIEYEMYKRLKVQSVLAVPYRNCGSGLLVIRNPKRFKDNHIALNIMSYVVTNELVSYKRRSNITRRTIEYEPKRYDQVMITLFGDMEIIGKELHFARKDLPEPIRFLIAYLASNPSRAVSAERLNELYSDRATQWKNIIYKFRIKWKGMRMMDGEEHQLIITTGKGYMLNPELEINIDVNNVVDLIKAIEDTSDVDAKIDMLQKFLALYRGEFMQNEEFDNLYIEEQRSLYITTFMGKMDMLLELLYSQKKYTNVIGYSMDILKIYPGNLNTYAWRIAAFKQLGQWELMKTTMDAAYSLMDAEERAMLEERVKVLTTTLESGRRSRLGKYHIGNKLKIR